MPAVEVATRVAKALLDSGSTCHLKQNSNGVERDLERTKSHAVKVVMRREP